MRTMERGYRRFVRRYPNSKIRVTKTRYPYGTKFRGLEEETSLSSSTEKVRCFLKLSLKNLRYLISKLGLDLENCKAFFSIEESVMIVVRTGVDARLRAYPNLKT